MFDLISIGDSVVDTFVFLEEAEVSTSHGEPMLCLRYGDKVPVGDSVSMVAGNAANNAIGAARLKLKNAIYTNIGNDSDGQRILTNFKEEKVDVRYVVKNQELPSNHHIVLDFKGERTILVHHQPWKFFLPDLDQTKWIYLTSLSPSFLGSNLYDQLTNYLERSNAKLLYNPGTFQIKSGVKKSPRLLSLTELFIVNVEEAKLILGHKEGESIQVKKLLRGLADLGPRQVIVTDGHEGSYGFDGEKYFKLAIFPAKLVEMTGSGDAFATGVMAGLFHDKSLDEAMRWGAANSASVVEQVGATAGLLTLAKMLERLKLNHKIVARILT